METLHRKNELLFAILWIIIYVIVFSIADGISEDLGIIKIITVPAGIIISLILLFFIKNNGFCKEYGLCSVSGKKSIYLFFIPLIVISTSNLWFGVELRYSAAETVLYIISMICVGFIEEIIFRGFLFKAMCKDSVKAAVIVSSVTFGIGHIINLVNGAEVAATLWQIGYATAAGFLFTVIFMKSGSLLPCIFAHMAINSLSIFAAERSAETETVSALVLIIVSAVYAVYIYKKADKNKE